MAEESHRLKPMVSNYDEKLFNELFEKTSGLRKSLVHGIDPNRFGVDSEELHSWFTVKFIYIFNKYCNDQPTRLLGYIINGLKMYKRRLIIEAYAKKNEVYATNSLDNFLGYGEFEEGTNKELPFDEHAENEYEYKQELLSTALKFLKYEISDDALFLLEVQLNPPPFILARMQEIDNHNLHKIPDEIIAEYMGIEAPDNFIGYFKALKAEIKYGIDKAKSLVSKGQILKPQLGN